MNYKKIIVIISILFIIGIPVYATPENKYVPKTEIFIQPLDGKRYNINDYKALEVGKKYQFQITSYIMKTTMNKLFGVQINESINAGISFDAPIIINVTDYPSNVAVDRKYNYTTYIYSAPIFRSTPKADETSRVQININFTPIKAGEQKVSILYSSEIDSRYWKDYYLTVEGAEDSSNTIPSPSQKKATPNPSPKSTNTTTSSSYSSNNSTSSTSSPEANYNLGNKYYAGGGYEKAVHYYELAANEGHADAQYRLGICFENGHGVQQDLKKAEYWFEKAATNGSLSAKVHLSDLKKEQKNTIQTPVNNQTLNNTQETSSDNTNATSLQSFNQTQQTMDNMVTQQQDIEELFNLGSYCFKQSEFKRGVSYFEKAAQQGHVEAQYQLGICYRNGTGVQRDLNQAKYWFEKAVQNGHPYAKNQLSDVEMSLRYGFY